MTSCDAHSASTLDTVSALEDRVTRYLPTDLQNWALVATAHWNEAHGVVHIIAGLLGLHCH